MTTNIQSLHFDADRKLLDFVNEKVNKLTVFYDGFISSDVILRLDKSSNSENKVAEIILHTKGQDLFSKKQSASFEESIDLVCEALKTQIKKYKEKVQETNLGVSELPE